jgi:hypothetical protein
MGKTYPNMCEASKAGAIPLLTLQGECESIKPRCPIDMPVCWMGVTYTNLCEASKAGAIPLLSTLGECIDNSQVVPFIGIVNEGTLPVGLLAGT